MHQNSEFRIENIISSITHKVQLHLRSSAVIKPLNVSHPTKNPQIL